MESGKCGFRSPGLPLSWRSCFMVPSLGLGCPWEGRGPWAGWLGMGSVSGTGQVPKQGLREPAGPTSLATWPTPGAQGWGKAGERGELVEPRTGPLSCQRGRQTQTGPLGRGISQGRGGEMRTHDSFAVSGLLCSGSPRWWSLSNPGVWVDGCQRLPNLHSNPEQTVG